MPYIGTQPLTGQFKKLDAITVVNGQAAYTLNHNGAAYRPATANALLVSVNGVIQAAGDAFNISGSTITFTENLVTGDVIDFIIALGDTGSAVTPVDGSVTTAKLGDDSVTKAKIGTTELDLATIKDSSGSNTAMTINSSGIISTPARPAFYAYGDDGWTGLASINTYHLAGFDHTEFNIGNHYNTSTKLFTVPVSGVYLFKFQAYFNDSGNPSIQVALQQTSGGSTSLIAFLSAQMAGDGVIELVRIYNAVAGQQIGAYVLKSSLIANTDYYLGINHSYFNGALLG